MAVQFKGTLFYQCLEAGWTENYWLLGPDAGAATAQLHNLNSARMPLSMSNVTLLDARIVDAANPRVSFRPDTSAWTLAGTYAGAGATTVTPDLSILFRTFSADDLNRSRLFLRGFPSDQFAGTGAGGPDAAFNFTVVYLAAVTAFRNALQVNTLLVHRTAPHTFIAKAVDRSSTSTQAHLRRAGRPLNLRRGRRLIA